MSADCASASAFTRALTSSTAVTTSPTVLTPTRSACANAVMASLVAMNVFDGTQSDSTHWPPTPSRSIRVTSAPSWSATSAASYPAGPPPMMAMRVMCPILPQRSRWGMLDPVPT